jgi:hypothetical protein
VDDRGGEARVPAIDEHPGAAESERRRIGPAHRCGHQRLGWGLAGHAGPRQSRSPMAASQSARACNQSGGQGARGAPRHLSELREIGTRMGG